MANEPKKHHYVPRLLLKNFADKKECLWIFRKQALKQGVVSSNYEIPFFENHLYAIPKAGGKKDLTLEYKFAKLESAIAPVVRHLCDEARNTKLAVLSRGDRKLWDDFFSAQTRRVPDYTRGRRFQHNYDDMVEEVVDGLQAEVGQTLHPKAREGVVEYLKSKDGRKTVTVGALGLPAKRIESALANSGLNVVRITRPNKSFVLGSDPIVNLSPNPIAISKSPQSENWLPIAPDIAICMTFDDPRNRFIELDDENAIRRINMAIFHKSSSVVATSDRLLGSLSKAFSKLNAR